MKTLLKLFTIFLIFFGWVLFPLISYYLFYSDVFVAFLIGEFIYLFFFMLQIGIVGNQEYRIYK